MSLGEDHKRNDKKENENRYCDYNNGTGRVLQYRDYIVILIW